jgi:predicted dehydrogenase
MGGVGQRHARNLRTLLGPDLTLFAYRTRPAAPVISERMQIESGADIASSHQLTEFSDLDAALAEHPDIVVISNPTSLHISTALTAARAGCHLFLEKPISHNLLGVRELLELVDEKNLVWVNVLDEEGGKGCLAGSFRTEKEDVGLVGKGRF